MSFNHYIQNVWSGISTLQKYTKGEGVKIAVLDGPIDITHSSFHNSKISFKNNDVTSGLATIHGTHVASIMLANSDSELKGICPKVECISIPIFREHKNGTIISSSQFELARAIEYALDEGVDIINISAGEKVSSAEPQRRLEKIIERCVENNVLLVSAVGNNGCPCIHIPAVHPGVLAVGALSKLGHPMEFSNWGEAYQFNGIMAPGEAIKGAMPGRGFAERNGTSFAAPIVSGVVALLYSYFKKQSNESITPLSIRKALLDTAHGCPLDQTEDGQACDRFLKGILNISGAFKYLKQNQHLPGDVKISMASNKSKTIIKSQRTSRLTDISLIPNYIQQGANSNWVVPSGFNIACLIKPQLVYTVGTLDIDFETDAVLDSFKFYMQGLTNGQGQIINHPNPYNPRQLLIYLNGQKDNNKGRTNIYEAERVTWVLKQNNTPIYAIKPRGPFSERAYELLIRFLKPFSDENEKGNNNAPYSYRMDLCSIPGHLIGQTKLRSGAIIPTIRPNIRAMYNWRLVDLVSHAVQLLEKNNQRVDKKRVRYLIDRLAHRLAFKMENIGLSAADRAMNHVATNLYYLGDAFVRKLTEGYELNDIQIQKSNHCRPDSDCQDVLLSFFNPFDRLGTSKHVFKCTIDVSGVIPVAIGEIQEWFDY